MNPDDDRDIRAYLSREPAPNGAAVLSTGAPGAVVPSLAEGADDDPCPSCGEQHTPEDAYLCLLTDLTEECYLGDAAEWADIIHRIRAMRHEWLREKARHAPATALEDR